MTKRKDPAINGRISAARSEQAKEQMNSQWERRRQDTGRPLGYYGCHRRVRAARGPAKEQACACGAQAAHWAHIHDTGPTDPQNYKAMCISCHRVYDRVRAKQAETLGAEGRTAAAELAWSRRTPEQRSEIVRKGWEARRANQG